MGVIDTTKIRKQTGDKGERNSEVCCIHISRRIFLYNLLPCNASKMDKRLTLKWNFIGWESQK
jgi:hypothetical protein